MSKPDVIQGRLGWESGDISEADPQNLKPHPKNREIYGDTSSAGDLDETFKQSVAEKGVLEPLVITNGKEIISGHRRWLAAKAAGVETVPVRYTEFDNELAEREALVEFNRQREKTPGQVVNEFEEMLAIEKERAKERQGERSDLDDETSAKDFTEVERATDKAAEKVNADVSGRTLQKGKTVKDKAQEGDEDAKDAWEQLEKGETSFHSAYEQVNGSSSESESDGSDIEQFTSQQTDEWSSPREIVEPLVDALGGFDLDPCSGAEDSPFAEQTYTEDDDGLAQAWHGTVWVNPPYSGVAEWVEKAAVEIDVNHADCILFLCKGDSSTDWWQQAAEDATAIAAIDHRLSFGDGENTAPFASHIFVFGDVPDSCYSALSKYATLLEVSVPTPQVTA